jgi:abhydrolase domain-containing protein 15
MFIYLLVTVTIVSLLLIGLLIKHGCKADGKELRELYYIDSDMAKYVLDRCPSLRAPFRPPFWLRNGHLQTILPVVFHAVKKIGYMRELVPVKDGGVVALDWIKDADCISSDENSRPILVAIPGLTGDAHSIYNLCKTSVRNNFRTVVFNKRGHGNSPMLTPKLQSFGDASDFREALLYIHKKYSGRDIVSVGVSAGSGLLVNYLGKYPAFPIIKCGVCVSPGYDAEEMFSKHVMQPYNYLMVRNLKGILKKHSEVLSQAIDVKRALSCPNLNEYEMEVYGKLYGYPDLTSYWEDNNPMKFTDHVTVPVLCINSQDDPVCVRGLVPVDNPTFASKGDKMLAFPKYGGHVGFISDLSFTSWADTVAIEYVIAVREYFRE